MLKNTPDTSPPRRLKLLNFAFILLSAAVLLLLLLAPEETTTRLPHDETHEPFYRIEKKKEAEQQCLNCHGERGEAPLPEDHPPPYRCLFCHKRDR